MTIADGSDRPNHVKDLGNNGEPAPHYVVSDRSTHDGVLIELESLRAEIRDLRQVIARLVSSPTENPHVLLETGARVVPSAVLLAPGPNHQIRLLAGSVVNRDCEINGPMTLGKRSFINKGGFVQGHVTVGISVAIGPFVRIVTDNHEVGTPHRRAGKSHSLPVTIGNGVWIGASVTILGGVTVGDGSIIGAGSLVKDDVPPNTVVAGVPAKVVRKLDQTNGPG
ncbi:hypothetical protein IG195_12470 [Arthrobacter sp. TES]|nr:hypothetical protein IG195_12470 [Arthrobacter sp. TES]